MDDVFDMLELKAGPPARGPPATKGQRSVVCAARVVAAGCAAVVAPVVDGTVGAVVARVGRSERRVVARCVCAAFVAGANVVVAVTIAGNS